MVALTRASTLIMEEKYNALCDMFNLIKTELSGMSIRIGTLLTEIKIRDEKIEALEGKVIHQTSVIEDLTVQVDDAEQYSRRLDLRVNGIPLPSGRESEEDVNNIVKALLAQMRDIPAEAIDHAHRVGKFR